MKALLPFLALLMSAPLSPAADPVPPPSLKKQLTETPLSSITIPSLNFDKVSLADAIAIFNDQVKKQTSGKIEIQWVYKDVDPEKWPHLITLDAKKITAAKLFSEIVSQSKISAKLDEHAIVIRPGGAAKEAAPAPSPPTGKVNAPARDAGFGNKSRLNIGPGLTRSGGVEADYIDGRYDKKPIKGRKPIKDPNPPSE